MQTARTAPKNIDQTPISWCEMGQGEPVIFLHAMVTSRTGWEPQMTALASDFRCIAWDMPGFGRSTPPADTAGFAEVLHSLVTFVTGTLGLERAHFVGLSVGGMILQHLAAQHPQLVISATMMDCSPKFGFGGGMTGDEFEAQMARQLDSTPLPQFCEGMIRAIVGPQTPEITIQAALGAMTRGTRQGLNYAVRLIARHDALDQLPLITCPVLVMAGANDGETPPAYAREIANRIPGANLSIIPNAGHIANLEAAQAVTVRLRVFLTHAL